MKIDTQNYNEISVLALQGEFTSEAVKSFEDAVSGVMASGSSGLVLDMSKVMALDSNALQNLLELNELCRENVRQLKLAGLDETCRKILEITQLLKEFDVYGDVAEAVRSFA